MPMMVTATSALAVKCACGRLHSANGNRHTNAAAWMEAVTAIGSMRVVARLSRGAVQPESAEPTMVATAAAMSWGEGWTGPSRTTSRMPAKATRQPAMRGQVSVSSFIQAEATAPNNTDVMFSTAL